MLFKSCHITADAEKWLVLAVRPSMLATLCGNILVIQSQLNDLVVSHGCFSFFFLIQAQSRPRYFFGANASVCTSLFVGCPDWLRSAVSLLTVHKSRGSNLSSSAILLAQSACRHRSLMRLSSGASGDSALRFLIPLRVPVLRLPMMS